MSEIVIQFWKEKAESLGYQLSIEQADTISQVFSGGYERHPIQFAKRFRHGDLELNTVRAFLPDAWRDKLDNCNLPMAEWREMFLAAGYTVDGRRVRRPRWPVRLYRGATDENRYGLSWTTNVDTAKWFAKFRQEPGGPLGKVWSVVAPTASLLARLPAKNESEYVVEARGLAITEVDPTKLSVQIASRLPAVRPPWVIKLWPKLSTI